MRRYEDVNEWEIRDMTKKPLGADAAAVESAGQGSEAPAIARHTRVDVVHLGCPGHLIVARHCHWRRHTQIGTKYRVSTVGDYYCYNKRQPLGKPLGASKDSFFETKVFETTDQPEAGSDGCGCLAPVSFSEIDGTHHSNAGAAQRGHEEYVRKYTAKAEGRSAS